MRTKEFRVQLSMRPQEDIPRLSEGTYWDPVMKQWFNLTYGPLGEAIVYFPSSGYYAQGFMPVEVYEAADVWPGVAPIDILYNDTIRVHYSFKFKGPSSSVTLQVGNCGLVGPNTYDRGSTKEKTISLSESLVDVTYSGYVDFIFGQPVILDKPHLFVLLHGQGYEIVYKNAFNPADVQFSELKITDYAKQ